MTIRILSFFDSQQHEADSLRSYLTIWNTVMGHSTLRKIKALLLDYTKENCLLGSFTGRFISGHWNRHHVDAVNKIIERITVNNELESPEEVVDELKAIQPHEGGSLFRRIQFIEERLEQQQKYIFGSKY